MIATPRRGMDMAQGPVVKHSVLIADPEFHMASLIAAMLRGFGHQMVSEVSDLRQLRSALTLRSFSLIILDGGLGLRGPLDTVRQMRTAAEHPNRFTPVIMTSVAPDAQLIARARDAGVTEFLRKPFSATDLQARIASLDLKPRNFVEAPDYAGPDRRRRQLDIGAAEQRTEAQDTKNLPGN